MKNCSGFAGYQLHPQLANSYLALQPYEGRFQCYSTVKAPIKFEQLAGAVHKRMSAVSVPESTATVHCTVILMAWIVVIRPRIVIAVISGEHHIVVVLKFISSVT